MEVLCSMYTGYFKEVCLGCLTWLGTASGQKKTQKEESLQQSQHSPFYFSVMQMI